VAFFDTLGAKQAKEVLILALKTIVLQTLKANITCKFTSWAQQRSQRISTNYVGHFEMQMSNLRLTKWKKK
jgi:hypothetical protein